MSLIDSILDREGGYVNNPADRGGPTNYGITQATLSAWRGWPASISDVQNLKRQEAVEIYEAKYVAPFERFAGAQKLLDLIVDSAVQHGTKRVQGWIDAIQSSDPDVVYKRLLRRRIEFYGEIITNNPSQATFAKGWMRRIAEFVR